MKKYSLFIIAFATFWTSPVVHARDCGAYAPGSVCYEENPNGGGRVGTGYIDNDGNFQSSSLQDNDNNGFADDLEWNYEGRLDITDDNSSLASTRDSFNKIILHENRFKDLAKQGKLPKGTVYVETGNAQDRLDALYTAEMAEYEKLLALYKKQMEQYNKEKDKKSVKKPVAPTKPKRLTLGDIPTGTTVNGLGYVGFSSRMEYMTDGEKKLYQSILGISNEEQNDSNAQENNQALEKIDSATEKKTLKQGWKKS